MDSTFGALATKSCRTAPIRLTISVCANVTSHESLSGFSLNLVLGFTKILST
jgi:hypothetical protein